MLSKFVRPVLGLFSCCLFANPAAAELRPVILDGSFDDWAGAVELVTDATGDAAGGAIDFARVWAADDGEYLYLRFETGAEIQGDEQQDLRLYLDTDLNAGTGTSFGGIGADLVWNFGGRDGQYRGTWIDHPDIGLLLGPTISSTEFEIALRLDARPTGGALLFPQASMRFILSDGSSGDRVPSSGAAAYVLDGGSVAVTPLDFARDAATHLRVGSYNIQSDGLFDGGARSAALSRLFEVIGADAWVICEVWNHSASQVANQMDVLAPLGGGDNWNAVKLDQGNVIVSRYPIAQSWEILPGARLTAALLDLSGVQDRDLLFIACHLSCCTADQNRQEQSDALIAFIRDAQTPGGVIDLAQDTPIVAAGDFNFVGWRQQFDTVITGNIDDNGAFGPDHAPDWDGSEFDLPPTRHTNANIGYTWRNDFSSFYPGLLDFTFVTGSVVGIGNHYLVDTRTMDATQLSAAGLLAGDSEEASDHLPRVLDLVYDQGTDAPAVRTGGLEWRGNVPNPFNPRTEFHFELARSVDVAKVVIYGAQGRRVREWTMRSLAAGPQTLSWDGTDSRGSSVASGTYFVEIDSDAGSASGKVVLVR